MPLQGRDGLVAPDERVEHAPDDLRNTQVVVRWPRTLAGRGAITDAVMRCYYEDAETVEFRFVNAGDRRVAKGFTARSLPKVLVRRSLRPHRCSAGQRAQVPHPRRAKRGARRHCRAARGLSANAVAITVLFSAAGPDDCCRPVAVDSSYVLGGSKERRLQGASPFG